MSGFECQTFLGSGRIDIPVQLHWDLDIVEFSDWEFDTFFTITKKEVDYRYPSICTTNAFQKKVVQIEFVQIASEYT